MIPDLRKKLEAQGNSRIASEMSKYLKDQFEMFGIMAKPRYELFKSFLSEKGFPGLDEISPLMKEAFDQPEREFHYFGIYLYEKSSKWLSKNHIEDIHYMITTHSWWDTVDYAISKTLSPVVLRNKELISSKMEAWNSNENIWLVRSSILFQLKWKTETDFELLSRFITNHMNSKEFFIQKAMGWALREYSKTDQLAVESFISEQDLPSLTKREGLKWLERRKTS